MNILLSGGWGYGNLGDDALLIDSIDLIRKYCENSHITVLTYDVFAAKSMLSKYHNIEFVPSLHLYIYGTEYFAHTKNDTHFISKLFNKIVGKIHDKRVERSEIREIEELIKHDNLEDTKFSFVQNYFAKFCQNQDIYIMSGGGYINNWHHSIVSKFLEIKIAKEKGLKTYVIGQTFGPFMPNVKPLAKKIILHSDCCFFRDSFSISDFPDVTNIYPKAIPDIALSKSFDVAERKKRIVLIPFTRQFWKSRKNILEIFSSCQQYEVVLSVSQLWKSQISLAIDLYMYLKSNSVRCSLHIPKDVTDLQQLLSESSCVLSENLHGLILAYRSHTPIICLNNKRKFITFMEKIECSNRMIPIIDLREDRFSEFLNNKMSFDSHNNIISELNDALNVVFS
ncbi:MAG: polysaccharide pyruvyl transferase family protein [Paludibacteraceae bacterium]|nr:polysaccharide pyruvyl transferase family protein [Paludibacteraceae bacterium]